MNLLKVTVKARRWAVYDGPLMDQRQNRFISDDVVGLQVLKWYSFRGPPLRVSAHNKPSIDNYLLLLPQALDAISVYPLWLLLSHMKRFINPSRARVLCVHLTAW